MKIGDLTRSTFDPDKAYSSVRKQQGRVQLDADWNEQCDIELYDEREFRSDIVGPGGAPAGNAGMEITSTGGALDVGAGRYYVDGIRCENADQHEIGNLPTTAGLYLVYLDAFERGITAVEDPDIREVALGGPDTATRTQVTWRAALLEVTTTDTDPNCTSIFPEWDTLLAGSTGVIEVRTTVPPTSSDPCAIPETAGYRGLENYLYRIEIHDGNLDPSAAGGIGTDTPTYKYSRENGSVLASWVAAPSGTDVEIDRLGPGGADGFSQGNFVELTTDLHATHEQPGVVAEIHDVSGSTLSLVDTGGLAAELSNAYDPDLHAKVRRWESDGAEAFATDTWVDLEEGLQVRFSADSSWRSGDYWLVAARTAILPGTIDQQIDWPVDAGGDPIPLTAFGPTHARARLAVVQFDGTNWTVLDDCRQFFVPLTSAIAFSARGGDGQFAPSGHWLPAPLIAGVSRGRHPVEGARVRFTIDNGALSAAEPDENGNAPGATTEVTVATDANGLARVWFQLGEGPNPEESGDTYQPDLSQEVVARLVDAGDNAEHLPLSFTAIPLDQLVLVDAGGNGQLGWPGETLEIALRARVTAGSRPAPGAQVLFEIENRVFDGLSLDEFTGGSVFASTNVVSQKPWPGGSRAQSAIVATDGDGVAQLQWVLGTEEGLPVQRVTAMLLEANGSTTAQSVLYTVHLAIAREVAWTPCRSLRGLLPGSRQPTVQDGLDLLCEPFGITAGNGTIRLADGTALDITPDRVVSVSAWEGLDFAIPIILATDPSPEALTAAVRVEADFDNGNGVRQSVRLNGKAAGSRRGRQTRVSWKMDGPSKDALARQVQSERAPIPMRVFLQFGLLSRELSSSMPWMRAFLVGP